MGFAMATLFIVPGLIALYVVGAIADTYGLRAGLLVVAPIFLVGAWILASGSIYVRSDINRVWTSTAAQAEVMLRRQQGEVKLLLVRNVDVHYDNVQVLFSVNFEVDEGEIVALLGTNGAGKSTLLKTISGLVEATNGAVVFDGRDMTYAPPNEVAGRGVVQMPGGQGVFPTLTVAEHLRLASWLHRKDKARRRGGDRTRARALPGPAGPPRRAGRQPLRRPAADARARHGVHREAAPVDDRRAVARPRARDRRTTPADRARHRRAGHDDHPRRAVGEPRARRSRRPRTSWRRARSASTGRPPSCSNGPTCCARCSSKARTRACRTAPRTATTDGRTRRPRRGGRLAATHPPRPSRPVRRRPRTNGDTRRGRRPCGSGSHDVSKRFGGLAALTDVSLQASGGRDRRVHRPERRGQDHAVRHDLGLRRRRSAARSSSAKATDAVDITRHVAGRRAPSSGSAARSRTAACSRTSLSRRRSRSRSNATSRSATRSRPRCDCRRCGTPNTTSTENVERLLELLGVTDFRDKLVRELSTGSRRIVDLACLLAHDPTVMLLDEPSSGIAQREAEALGPLLLRIREQTGATLLVIEHDVPLLLGIADRLVALDLGEVVANGLARRGRQRPRRRAVVSRHQRGRHRPQWGATRLATHHADSQESITNTNRGTRDGNATDTTAPEVAVGALRTVHRRSWSSSRSWASSSRRAAATARATRRSAWRRPRPRRACRARTASRCSTTTPRRRASRPRSSGTTATPRPAASRSRS